jgi:hypothetical protein
MPLTMEEKFHASYIPEPMSGCWLWEGPVNAHGYGRLSAGGKSWTAHRASYEIHKGPIHSGLWVLHTCDQPGCVNPDHLYLGTVVENVRDMMQRGRHVRWNGTRRGTGNPKSRLTPEQVQEIRCLPPGLTRRQAGRLYGVSHATIIDIIKGRTWSE